MIETKTAKQLLNSGIIEVEQWRMDEFPDCGHEELCSNQFLMFILKSLCSNRNNWKKRKGRRLETINNAEEFCVYFKRMNTSLTYNFTNAEDMIRFIDQKKNELVNLKKYYCYYGNAKKFYEEVRRKKVWHNVDDRNKDLRDRILSDNYEPDDEVQCDDNPYIEQDLFVEESLKNSQDFLTQFYRVCYIYKILKLMRNDTVHILGRYNYTSQEVASWIQFYIQQLEQLIQKAKTIHH